MTCVNPGGPRGGALGRRTLANRVRERRHDNPEPRGPAEEIVIISHSTIFYWWPVWFVGFLMAALTYLDGHLMAIVPGGPSPRGQDRSAGTRAPATSWCSRRRSSCPRTRRPGPRSSRDFTMAASNSPGIIFAITLCLVIVITNIHMRGLWSVIAILAVAFASVLLAVLGWWDAILGALGVIDIHINALGYLSISLFLFAVWAVTFLVYDRRMSTVFSRGQVRVRTAIGGGETTYDTLGMRVEKHTDDVFRHWLLGFGAGDLTVRTAGTNAPHFEIPNVIRVNRKLEMIRRMLQEREVVGGKP